MKTKKRVCKSKKKPISRKEKVKQSTQDVPVVFGGAIEEIERESLDSDVEEETELDMDGFGEEEDVSMEEEGSDFDEE